jgi:hypothetical protein
MFFRKTATALWKTSVEMASPNSAASRDEGNRRARLVKTFCAMELARLADRVFLNSACLSM